MSPVLGVGLADPVEELGANDAAAPPDRGHGAEATPSRWSGTRPASERTLGVGHDLGRVQRLADVIDEVVGHATFPRPRPGQRGRGRPALVAQRRERAREHGLGDPRERHPEIECVLAVQPPVPFARPGRGSRPRAACRFSVGLLQHDRRDLDEERLEVARVPLLEDLADRRGFEAADVGEQVVRLRDELHVGVLDAVVHHLHVVARRRPARRACSTACRRRSRRSRRGPPRPRRTPLGRRRA